METDNSFPYLYTIKESNHDTNLYLISLKKDKYKENRTKINSNLVITNPTIGKSFKNFEFSQMKNKKPFDENENSKCPLDEKKPKLY